VTVTLPASPDSDRPVQYGVGSAERPARLHPRRPSSVRPVPHRRFSTVAIWGRPCLPQKQVVDRWESHPDLRLAGRPFPGSHQQSCSPPNHEL